MTDSLDAQAVAPATSPKRPLYWLLRRELWENRSLYVAPVVIAGLVLFGFMISTITLPRRMRALLAAGAVKQQEAVHMPYDMVAGLVVVTAFIVGVFYCLDALYGERRDRSILFWKSLPVSDRMTVLSKALMPLAVVPLIALVLVLFTQVLMLTMNTAVLLGHQNLLAMLWSNIRFVQSSLAFVYALIAIALWHAPVYAWLLMISAWAKRVPLLWAVLPPLMVAAFERMAFGTKFIAELLGYRLVGWFQRAFVMHLPSSADELEPLRHLTPIEFLSTPGLWVGLVFAAIFLAAAIRLRHTREPI